MLVFKQLFTFFNALFHLDRNNPVQNVLVLFVLNLFFLNSLCCLKKNKLVLTSLVEFLILSNPLDTSLSNKKIRPTQTRTNNLSRIIPALDFEIGRVNKP